MATSDHNVLRAIREWQGNVSAAADALGMHRNNLMKRLARLGVDPAALRGRGGSKIRCTATPATPHTATPATPRGAYGADNSGVAISTRASARSTLDSVEATAEPDAPIRTVRTSRKPVRLRPAHQDQLREAKLDLGARYRIDTDENAILDQFFEERFEAWLSEKLDGDGQKPGDGE